MKLLLQIQDHRPDCIMMKLSLSQRVQPPTRTSERPPGMHRFFIAFALLIHRFFIAYGVPFITYLAIRARYRASTTGPRKLV